MEIFSKSLGHRDHTLHRNEVQCILDRYNFKLYMKSQ